MTTNRGEMPAMPCQQSINRDTGELQPHQFGNDDFVIAGLSIREQFAMAAPSEIPKWFLCAWLDKPEANNPDYHWYREADVCGPSEAGLTDKGEQALYFSWRAHYADALLAELERNQ